MTFLHARDATTIARRAARQHWLNRVTGATKFVLGTGLVFAAVYLIASAPAQYERLEFALTSSTQSRAPGQPSTAPTVAKNTLVIPSLTVEAPILWNVPLNDALNGLQRGVVHAQETVLPGNAGRTFVIGHSAGYWWTRNPWTKVFALLEELEPGELIYLDYEGNRYVYRVTRSETVLPRDVQVLTAGPADRNELALMTCTPVGTTLRRLIVLAEPVTQ